MGSPVTDTITVVLVDDQLSYAEALARVFADEPDVEVVGICANSVEAAEYVLARNPNVVLLNYTMPDVDGAAVAAEVRRHRPETRIIMVTGVTDDEALLAAVTAGCAGFVVKQGPVRDIVAAIRTVAAGGSLFPGGVLSRLLPRVAESRSDGDDLTERERSVLELLAGGWGNREIATHLHLSVNTVRNYVQAVLVKLGAHSKLEAVAIASRRGLVSFDGRR